LNIRSIKQNLWQALFFSIRYNSRFANHDETNSDLGIFWTVSVWDFGNRASGSVPTRLPKISLAFLGLLPSSVSGVREWFGISFGIGVATEKISKLSSSYTTESRTVNHQVGGSSPSGGAK
jgi:hypothetical protein